jgi:citronellol/citronellal dehydrogenase
VSSAIFAPDLLAGRVALVTGGGKGLGKATARKRVACGADVVIAGRRAEVLQAAVRGARTPVRVGGGRRAR